jgi:hypothetical protein
MSEPKLSRRQLATAGATAVAALGAAGAGRAQQAAPDALKSEFLMDLILETGGPGGGNVGNRMIVPVIGGTFEGPKLRGKVMPPGADWLVKINDTLRWLDIRTLLLTR